MSYYQINIKKTPPNLDLSVVIPVKDEEDNVVDVAEEIADVLSLTELDWECIWVDDGSTDSTLSLLQSLNKKDQHHKYISFDQNYGQSAAFAAGFSHAEGEVIVT